MNRHIFNDGRAQALPGVCGHDGFKPVTEGALDNVIPSDDARGEGVIYVWGRKTWVARPELNAAHKHMNTSSLSNTRSRDTPTDTPVTVATVRARDVFAYFSHWFLTIDSGAHPIALLPTADLILIRSQLAQAQLCFAGFPN
jgi:hypothetical protein